jgi:hypothetical protein
LAALTWGVTARNFGSRNCEELELSHGWHVAPVTDKGGERRGSTAHRPSRHNSEKNQDTNDNKKAVRRGASRIMKILVAVKRVVDYAVKIRVKADGSGIELANV